MSAPKPSAPAMDPLPLAVLGTIRGVFDDDTITTPSQRARAALRPSLNGAMALEMISPLRGQLEMLALSDELSRQAKMVNEGDLSIMEGTLAVQARTLDALFNALTSRAVANALSPDGPFADAADLYLRLALKAQSQCRATIETLALMKNPPQVAFVRQANIAAGPQQVNNGVPPPAREKVETAPTELLEAMHGERLDSGAPSASARTNQAMATVAAIDRAANGGRKGARSAERLQGRRAPASAANGRGSKAAGQGAARSSMMDKGELR
jgi:hypothetical protein